MDPTTLFAAAAAFVSAVSATIAAIATRRWGPEFERAKNEVIRAKEAQIDSLQKAVETQREIQSEISPAVLRESYNRMRDQLEEYIEFLKKELASSRERIQEAGRRLENLEQDTSEKTMKAVSLERERDDLRERLNSLETKIRILEEVQTNLRRGEQEHVNHGAIIPDELRNPWFG